MSKTAKDAGSVAVSENEAGLEPGNVENDKTALVVTGDGDVSGSLLLALSQDAQDEAMRTLIEGLHQVQEGFGELTKPGDIFNMDRSFNVIDATTINDFTDQNTGEVKTKHIFKLEFSEGDVRLVMQSDARPRAILASVFTRARLLGERIVAGPYKFSRKPIPRQIQPAYIFTQQPGFYAGPVNRRPGV